MEKTSQARVWKVSSAFDSCLTSASGVTLFILSKNPFQSCSKHFKVWVSLSWLIILLAAVSNLMIRPQETLTTHIEPNKLYMCMHVCIYQKSSWNPFTIYLISAMWCIFSVKWKKCGFYPQELLDHEKWAFYTWIEPGLNWVCSWHPLLRRLFGLNVEDQLLLRILLTGF